MKFKKSTRFLLSLCLMTLTFLCGGNKAWAAEQTYSYIQSGTTSPFKVSGKTGTATLSGVAWTVTSTATTLVTNANTVSKTNQFYFGNSKSKPGTLTFKTSGICGTIKSISIKAKVQNSESNATITMSVNGSSYTSGGATSVKISGTSFNTYTFTGSSSGEIIITAGKFTAGYFGIASITIVYEEAASAPAPTFSLPGGTYYGDQSVSISVDGTGSILYTTNGDDPKTKGTKYTEAIPLPVGTKLTLQAVAKYGEGLFSDVTVATYDIQKKSPSFYQRITSAAELTANETYLIVCESKSKAFGKINSNKKGTPQDVTITDHKIDLSADGTGTPTEFILEKSNESGYLLKNASTKTYITTPDKTNIEESETGTNLTITFNSDGTANIVGISGRCIWYGKDQGVFGNYATKNETGYAKVYLYKKHVIKEFSEAEDLTASLPETELADQTVTLNRNLYSGWNTFCVPFALTQTQLKEAYGSGAVAKYLSGVTTDGAAATLHFTPEEGGGIEANKAYLLYLTDEVKEAKTFSGVTLQPAGDCTTTVSAADGDYTFQGILAPTALAKDDTQYFLNSAGTYFVLPLDNTSQLKATRAYIIVPKAAGSAQGRQYSFDFNGTTTAIDNVTISGMEDGAWYTISGIRINRPAAKGVYIHNGRKVIVK